MKVLARIAMVFAAVALAAIALAAIAWAAMAQDAMPQAAGLPFSARLWVEHRVPPASRRYHPDCWRPARRALPTLSVR